MVRKEIFLLGLPSVNLLKAMGFPENIVMVKVDGRPIDKEDYSQQLDENSNVEIFSLIGGG